MLTDMTVQQAKATGKPYTIADFDGVSLFVSANAPRLGTSATPGWASAPASTNGPASRSCRGLR